MRLFIIWLCLWMLLIMSCADQPGSQSASHFSDSNLSEDAVTDGFNKNRNAYFGDLHVHSSWSFDAFIYNVRTSPADAYRFGKGEMIQHPVAGEIQNSRPLDFMSVTDHAEYMGIMMQMLDKDNPLAKLEFAKKIRSEDRAESLAAFAAVSYTHLTLPTICSV